MDFELSPEHEMIRQTARDFAEKEIRPVAAHVDKTGEFPKATIAKRGKDGWVLNGTKNLCTNAPVAGTFVIHAITDPKKGNHGISAFIVERGNPGLSIGRVEDKLGVRGSPTSQVILTDCHVPSTTLLGKENEGFQNALKVLDGGRIGIGAMAVGIAQGAFEESVKYAKERVQFAKPIAEHHVIPFMSKYMD